RALDSSLFPYTTLFRSINNTGFSDTVWKTNPNYRWATFAVIGSMIDMVIPDVVANDFMQFAEVRNGGFGDNFVFDIASSDLFIVDRKSTRLNSSHVKIS